MPLGMLGIARVAKWLANEQTVSSCTTWINDLLIVPRRSGCSFAGVWITLVLASSRRPCSGGPCSGDRCSR
jgi:hypothetical protein